MRLIVPFAMLLAGCSAERQPGNNFAQAARDELDALTERPGMPPVSERTWAATRTLECRPLVSDYCEAQACRRVRPLPTWIRWTPATRLYQGCVEAGCRNYQAEVTYDGPYATIRMPGRNTTFRLTADNIYTEVQTPGRSVLIEHGRCREVEGPGPLRLGERPWDAEADPGNSN